MGALISCLSPPKKLSRPRTTPRRRPGGGSYSASPGSSGRGSWSRSGRREDSGPLSHDEVLAAAAMLLRKHRDSSGGGRGGGGGASMLPFDGSASAVDLRAGGKKGQLPRSSSTRSRSSLDPLIQPQEMINQNLKIDNLESSHFVLVHGGGFGAWCWYKTIALLEESGFKVEAIDLTGSGINSFDSNNVKSLAHYVKPLTDFLETLCEEKVILVGHDFGGTCISYAMEAYPSKVAKAIFVSATIPKNGQSTLDMFSQKNSTDDLMQQAQIFVYGNGKEQPATAIDLNKSLVKHLMFNQTPVKDVALAAVSMRLVPFAPVLESLELSDQNYGSVRRFFVETTEDNTIPLALQQSMCDSNPPEKVFRLKGADHAPFFSKPQALHKLLVEIAKMPPLQVAHAAAAAAQ